MARSTGDGAGPRASGVWLLWRRVPPKALGRLTTAPLLPAVPEVGLVPGGTGTCGLPSGAGVRLFYSPRCISCEALAVKVMVEGGALVARCGSCGVVQPRHGRRCAGCGAPMTAQRRDARHCSAPGRVPAGAGPPETDRPLPFAP